MVIPVAGTSILDGPMVPPGLRRRGPSEIGCRYANMGGQCFPLEGFSLAGGAHQWSGPLRLLSPFDELCSFSACHFLNLPNMLVANG